MVSGMAMYGLAYVFINYAQALRLGHVGWGFSIDEGDTFCYGSTDHLYREAMWNAIAVVKYMNVAPEDDNDFWFATGTRDEMLEAMANGHHLRYHAYKVLPVRDPIPEQAKKVAESYEKIGWNVAFNNCVHQSYKLLTEYGAETLPHPNVPVKHRIPRSWFSEIPTRRKLL
jgi:hypothetical protein